MTIEILNMHNYDIEVMIIVTITKMHGMIGCMGVKIWVILKNDILIDIENGGH